jgi:hypothetical protein
MARVLPPTADGERRRRGEFPPVSGVRRHCRNERRERVVLGVEHQLGLGDHVVERAARKLENLFTPPNARKSHRLYVKIVLRGSLVVRYRCDIPFLSHSRALHSRAPRTERSDVSETKNAQNPDR